MTLLEVLLAEVRSDPAKAAELRAVLAGEEDTRLLKPREAADLLGVHPDTLTRAAKAGRVRGAVRQGVKLWRFRASDLELLPPVPVDVGPAGPGRPARRVGDSSAVQAIKTGVSSEHRAA